MQKNIIASDVTDGEGGPNPPRQSKCENWTATSSDISILVFVWFSVGCCFWNFTDYFPVIYGFSITTTSGFTITSHVFSECWLVGPVQ